VVFLSLLVLIDKSKANFHERKPYLEKTNYSPFSFSLGPIYEQNMSEIDFSTCATVRLTCERRGVRAVVSPPKMIFGGEKRQPEIRLRSQATVWSIFMESRS